ADRQSLASQTERNHPASYGESLIEDAALTRQVRADTAAVLHLDNVCASVCGGAADKPCVAHLRRRPAMARTVADQFAEILATAGEILRCCPRLTFSGRSSFARAAEPT